MPQHQLPKMVAIAVLASVLSIATAAQAVSSGVDGHLPESPTRNQRPQRSALGSSARVVPSRVAAYCALS